MSANNEEAKKAALIRKMWGHIYPVANIAKEWAFILLHPDFDKEPELRNRAFCIWICALAESASESTNKVRSLRENARSVKSETAIHYVNILDKLHQGVADVISVFSFEEMVLIQLHREEAVHGRLTSSHKRINYYSEGGIKVKSIPAEEASSIRINMWASEGWEPPLTRARVRFMRRPSLFWPIHDLFIDDKVIQRVFNDIEQWNNELTPGVIIEFIDDSFLITQQKRPECTRSFWSSRAAIAHDHSSRLDPALAMLRERGEGDSGGADV
jgi:hypothetical protein